MRVAIFFGVLLAGCGSTGGSTDGGVIVTADAGPVTLSDGGVSDCSAFSGVAKVVCAANALLDVAPTVSLAFTDNASRTKWSNLPGVTRAGVKMGALSSNGQTAALAVMAAALTSAGYTDLAGVLAADDYLGSLSGGGGMSGQYSSTNYSIAIFGSPSTTGDWALAFGGHHMAFNITYLAGVGYTTPHHIGVEPKASFTINGSTYEPLSAEGAALFGIFSGLTSGELSSAYLTGQTFSDVVVGPVEYGTGSSATSKAKFPSGANRKGVLVSSLSASQKVLVSAAISQFVDDYDPSVATALTAAYTSAEAFADTYVAWGGAASGPDAEVNGTYLRIDGPRLWVELSCQAGVVVSGKSHYHGIFRDKQFDYGGTL